MKVLVAPDKFKGSLSAAEAASAIARGWQRGWPGCEIEQAPMADGGEGFAEIFQAALEGEWVEVPAHDPLGRPITARYVWVADQRLAILNMSEASGLWRLRTDERAPLVADTFGTGELLRHATERGARRILVGLGGSATTDGGTGMASALGYRFVSASGKELKAGPRSLTELHEVETSGRIALPEVIGACDVTNPLLGPQGTAAIFSPQKGAQPHDVVTLEAALTRMAEVTEAALGRSYHEVPGAGAAGGLGFGLLAFCRGSLRPGFDLVAETLRLEEKLAACDLVITGEGRLDGQTLSGKGPAGLAAMARRAGRPVLAMAGSLASEEGAEELFDATCPIIDTPLALEAAMAQASVLLERAAGRAARLIRLGGTWSGSAPH